MSISSAVFRDGEALLLFAEPTCEALLSWNAAAPAAIDLRVIFTDQKCSSWLEYVRTDPWRSCSGSDVDVRVEVDTIIGKQPFIGIEARARGVQSAYVVTKHVAAATIDKASDSIVLATNIPENAVTTIGRAAIELAVPPQSQYVGDERGWCNAATLTMLLNFWAAAYHRDDWKTDLRDVATAIYDPTYGGTGNWSFAAAYATHLGLRGLMIFVPSLRGAEHLLQAGFPFAASIAWEKDELPGAPLPRSDGHVLVVCGIDDNGDVLVRDPALPAVAGRYPRAQFANVWQRSGAAGYIVAPYEEESRLVDLLRQVMKYV